MTLRAPSRKVSSVRSGVANGSPGPAMPTTAMRGSFLQHGIQIAERLPSARAAAVVTPGRLSLAQSYTRRQKLHWMLQSGATGRWMRAKAVACRIVETGMSENVQCHEPISPSHIAVTHRRCVLGGSRSPH